MGWIRAQNFHKRKQLEDRDHQGAIYHLLPQHLPKAQIWSRLKLLAEFKNALLDQPISSYQVMFLSFNLDFKMYYLKCIIEPVRRLLKDCKRL